MDLEAKGQLSGPNPSLGGVVLSDPPHLPGGAYIVICSLIQQLFAWRLPRADPVRGASTDESDAVCALGELTAQWRDQRRMRFPQCDPSWWECARKGATKCCRSTWKASQGR